MRTFSLAALAVVATVTMITLVAIGGGGGTGGPELVILDTAIKPAEDIVGTAFSCTGPITVTATVGGNHLPGSPDISSFGATQNPFVFPAPNENCTVTVKMVDGNGNSVTTYVDVNTSN